jgi:hypothetical protein
MFTRFVSSAALPAVAVVVLAVGLSFAGQSAPSGGAQDQVSSTTAQPSCCPECCPDCPDCPECCGSACGAACCDSTAAAKARVAKAAQGCSGSTCCAK